MRFRVLALCGVVTACVSEVVEPPDSGVGQVDAGTRDSGAPPFVPGGFSDADVPGSFDGGTWVPGRDDAGIVTEASWNLVPIGQGVLVEGTKLDGLDDLVKTQVPGWSDFGNGRWGGVMGAWNGFALDVDNSRAWLVAAGGHSDSSNNGIYRFDLFRMAWSVEQLPSDPTPWSMAYRNSAASGSFTPCVESDAEFRARLDAGTLQPIDDWYWDELYWDRAPTARHLYSSAVYVPGRNELVIAVRRFWRYSLDRHAWIQKRLINDSPEQAMAGSGTYAYYDEKTDEVLMGGVGDGIYNAFALPLDGGAWSRWHLIGGNDGLADSRDGRFITGFAPPAQTDFAYASPGRYYRYSLDERRNVDAGEIQYGADLQRTDFPRGYEFYDGWAMAYVPQLERYWVATRVNGAMQFLELDPTTSPWTLRRLVVPGVQPAWDLIISRKLVYWPRLKALTLTTRSDANVWLYRLE